MFLTLLAWKVLVRVFMKEAAPLSLEDPPAGETIEPDFRAKRMTVLVIVLVTVSLWLTSPLHHLGAAAVAAVPLVFLPMSRILKAEDIRAIGWDTLILVAGGLALGAALQQTGLLEPVRRPDRHARGARRRVLRRSSRTRRCSSPTS